MKINRNSWHARWTYWCLTEKEQTEGMPNNFCDYSKLLIRSALFIVCLTVMALMFLSGVFFAIPMAVWHFWPYSLIPISFIALVILWACVKDKEIIREFLKAKKEKYCPRIEWE